MLLVPLRLGLLVLLVLGWLLLPHMLLIDAFASLMTMHSKPIQAQHK